MSWTAQTPWYQHSPWVDEYYPWLTASYPWLLENDNIDWIPRPVIT